MTLAVGLITVAMTALAALALWGAWALGERGDRRRRAHAPNRRYLPLFERVAVTNALVLIAAVAVTIVVLDPGKLSTFAVEELIVLAAALTLAVLANAYLLQRVVGPVQSLTALARRVDLTNPGRRMPGAVATSEVGELALTFNEMLDRLEAERREAARRVLAGQEAERLRIAQELHDQVGQQLTAVLLGLARVEARAPDRMRADVLHAQRAVRSNLEDVRQISIELRPEALDDLGVASALVVLCERLAERFALEVTQDIAADLPALSPERELVVYRVAQEALTNVARHSGSNRTTMTLAVADGRLTLTVSDHGRGLPAGLVPGSGIRGMRERATLVGAALAVHNRAAETGCEVRLELPAADAALAP